MGLIQLLPKPVSLRAAGYHNLHWKYICTSRCKHALIEMPACALRVTFHTQLTSGMCA